jgi:hypothetical protein
VLLRRKELVIVLGIECGAEFRRKKGKIGTDEITGKGAQE